MGHRQLQIWQARAHSSFLQELLGIKKHKIAAASCIRLRPLVMHQTLT